MHVLIKRKEQEGLPAAEMPAKPVSAAVKVEEAESITAPRVLAVEGKRARKMRIMRENGDRFVTFYISAALWKRFVKLYCPRGTTPNMVFCRMVRQAVEARTEDGAQIVPKRG